jgi:hypothetical protein
MVPTDWSIALVGADRTLSTPVLLSDYTDLLGPVGDFAERLHSTLKTVRIPLTDFTAIDLSIVRGLRLTFDQTRSGEIYLADIRLGSFTEALVPGPAGIIPTPFLTEQRQTVPLIAASTENVGVGQRMVKHIGQVREIRRVAASSVLEGNDAVEIELDLNENRFPVRDALAVLQVGDSRWTLSRYPESGETTRLIFTIPAADFAELPEGGETRVYYGDTESSMSNWVAEFGNLSKDMLK